jgi:GH25 family lysozyme M1 (1,4-beta-N-acetylmuramidase)
VVYLAYQNTASTARYTMLVQSMYLNSASNWQPRIENKSSASSSSFRNYDKKRYEKSMSSFQRWAEAQLGEIPCIYIANT